MAVKAECHLKKYIRELKTSAMSEEGEIKTSVKDLVIKTAIKVTERRLKDLNELIDDPKAFENLVSPAEWKILGAGELNEKKLQKQNHEKWLKSQNMALPPKPTKKKKAKKPKTPNDVAGESSESSVEEEDEQDEDAIDKAI